ncbi:MAG: murein biosynthesis integral membrane protein MurJ [Caulobacterales bacterium]|nr:murein biosynthesis integral membrane protein MurJ [Caulobacterales bacterium]
MSLARNTFVQFSFTLLSRLFGYARDRIISNMVGAGFIGDALVMAQTFPNLFRRILAEGAFSQAFVPLYAKKVKKDGDESAAEMASEAFSVLALASIIIVIIAQIFMPAIVWLLHNGQAKNPEAYKLTILLTQITMPYLVGMSASALFAGILNTASKFALSAFAPTLLNLTILAFVIFTKNPVQAATNAAIAITVAGLLQAGLLFYGCRRLGVKIGFKIPKLTEDVKTILKVMAPSVIAGSATQINIMISQPLQSFEVGAKTWLYFADRFYQLPLGLIGVAISVALLPRLSSAIASKNLKDGQKALNEGFILSMALTLPAAAALLAIPYFLMYGFWEGGEFTVQDSHNAANALFHYAWGVPAMVLIRIFAPPFFARQDTKSPMKFAIWGVVSNIIIGASLFFVFHNINKTGYIGLAIGTSFAAWLNAISLMVSLIKRRWWYFERNVIDKLSRIIAACLVMATFLFMVHIYSDIVFEWFDFMKIGGKEIAVILVSLIGIIIYGIFSLLFGALTIKDIKALVKK